MKICPNGHGKGGYNFCSDCGARLVVNPKEIHCAACGLEILPVDRKFCVRCGARIRDDAGNVIPPPPKPSLWQRFLDFLRNL